MNGRLLVLLFAGVGCGFAAGWLARPTGDTQDLVLEVSRPQESPESLADREASPREVALDIDAHADRTPPGPRTPSTPSPALVGSRRDVLKRFEADLSGAYRRLSGGEDPTPEQVARMVEIHSQQLGTAGEAWARMLWKEEEKRRTFGELTDPAEVVLQARGADNVEVAMVDERPQRHRPPYAEAPLDLVSGVEANAPPAAYVKGGVIPQGRVFVVERIEIEAVWTRDSTGRPRGDLDLDVPSALDLDLRAVGSRMRAVYEGIGILEHGEEDRVRLRSRGGAVSVRITGRVMPRADAPWSSRRKLHATVFEGDGYLTGAPVLLQIASGRNRGQVNLDPQDDRVGDYADRDLWNEPVDLEGRQRPRAYTRNRGMIPPGKVFEITSLTWRVRPSTEKGEVRFRLGKEWILDPRQKLDGETRGTWTGSHVVKPGREDKIEISAERTVVEVRLEGNLRAP